MQAALHDHMETYWAGVWAQATETGEACALDLDHRGKECNYDKIQSNQLGVLAVPLVGSYLVCMMYLYMLVAFVVTLSSFSIALLAG